MTRPPPPPGAIWEMSGECRGQPRPSPGCKVGGQQDCASRTEQGVGGGALVVLRLESPGLPPHSQGLQPWMCRQRICLMASDNWKPAFIWVTAPVCSIVSKLNSLGEKTRVPRLLRWPSRTWRFGPPAGNQAEALHPCLTAFRVAALAPRGSVSGSAKEAACSVNSVSHTLT